MTLSVVHADVLFTLIDWDANVIFFFVSRIATTAFNCMVFEMLVRNLQAFITTDFVLACWMKNAVARISCWQLAFIYIFGAETSAVGYLRHLYLIVEVLQAWFQWQLTVSPVKVITEQSQTARPSSPTSFTHWCLRAHSLSGVSHMVVKVWRSSWFS